MLESACRFALIYADNRLIDQLFSYFRAKSLNFIRLLVCIDILILKVYNIKEQRF